MIELLLPWPARDLRPNARAHWSADEDIALAAALSAGATHNEVGAAAGRPESGVRNRAWRLGLVKNRGWPPEDVAALVGLYARIPLDCVAIADRLGRSVDACQLKAGKLGITDIRRPKKLPEDKVPKNKYASLAEARAAISEASKRRIAENGHPRGALGMKHTDEAKKRIGLASRAVWDDPCSAFNSTANRQRLSDNMCAMQAAGKLRNGYTRARGGKRNDLGGVYFRSAWEANYARYLNLLVGRGEIAAWAFEPKTFEFTRIKRGTRSYTPDFRVDQVGGGHVWHEVKGWMDAKSKTRLARFARYFPEERLIVVDSKWFKAANKTLPSLIPTWESGTVHV